MYQRLKKYLSVNTLFEASDNQYWNDAYISKNLLQAHLEKNMDNASRNETFIRDSLSFLDRVLKEHQIKSIFDFGCGPGLYCEGFYKQGYDVLGVDLSQTAIAYAQNSARQKGYLIDYRNENYLHLEKSVSSDCVSLIYCDYGSLSQTDRKTLLRKIHQTLNEEGIFIMDVFSVQKYLSIQEKTQFRHVDTQSFWYPTAHLEFSMTQTFPHFIALDKTVIIAQDEEKVIHRWYQYFDLHTLQSELEASGFEVLDVWADLLGNPYNQTSETIALVAKKK